MLLPLLLLASAAAAANSNDNDHEAAGADWLPSPPAPPWRNDTENIRVTTALNAYIAQTLFKTESGYEGPTTDARPISLAWEIAGEMPRAGKDGLACW